MTDNLKEMTTKERILECAAILFAEKGYTETSIREIAKAVGVKNPASIYFYFASKSALLEHMLDDYREFNTDVFNKKNIPETLRSNPTKEGIMACYHTVFPAGRVEYYLKVLCVLLQEQLRNDVVKRYISNHIILSAEHNTKTVIDALKDLGIVKEDTDTDYWTKVVSSLMYTFATRSMLSIGDTEPGFEGKGMIEMLEHTFEMMLVMNGNNYS